MSKKTLQLGEQALRLALAVAALVLAALIAHPKQTGTKLLLAAGPKPGVVMEW